VTKFFAHVTGRLDGAADVEIWLCVGPTDAVTALSEDAAVRALLLATTDTDTPSDRSAVLARWCSLSWTLPCRTQVRAVDELAARQVSEWLTRAALFYTTCPSPTTTSTAPRGYAPWSRTASCPAWPLRDSPR
jgi:hypothetical protein